MNNKMSICTYVSTTEYKKQTRQTRTETESRYEEHLREWGILGGGRQQGKNWDN